MKIRRNVASVPLRSAKDTWSLITELVTGTDTVDCNQLNAAASIMESLIADEHPAKVPIVFKGVGPRVVIYCLYNEDAMEAGPEVDPLKYNPTAGEWRTTAPCEAEDVDWMNKTLKHRAQRITCMTSISLPRNKRAAKRDRWVSIWRSIGEPWPSHECDRCP